MIDSTQATTVAEPALKRTQIQVPADLWDEIKIQAVRDGLTAGQIATKAFEAYLESVRRTQ